MAPITRCFHADETIGGPMRAAFADGAGARRRAMVIHWRRDADAAIEQAKHEQRWLLLDFSAAPM